LISDQSFSLYTFFRRIRGALGALIIVMVNLGLVVGYAINSYLDYYTVPYILIAIFVVFYAGFSFAAESPKYHAMKADFSSAKRSLQYFRGYDNSAGAFSSDFEAEMDILKGLNARRGVAARLKWQDFCKFYGKTC
jgi:hypothetical protein